MKRIISCMLALIMVLSLAACGTSANRSQTSTSENGTTPAESTTATGTEELTSSPITQENENRYIGKTDFLIPDEVTEVKCTNSEIIELSEEDEDSYGGYYDRKVIFTYQNKEDAQTAFTQYYRDYLENTFSEDFYTFRDSNGNVITFDNTDIKEKGLWTIYIGRETGEPVVGDNTYKEMVGNYLLVEYGDDTDTIKRAWEDKSFYQYLEITEEGKVIYYSFTKEIGTETVEEYTLDQFLGYSNVEYKNGKITQTFSGFTAVFEKTDEIPDMEN